MHKLFSISVLFLLSCTMLVSQSQQGGFIEAWNNYPTGSFGPKTVQFDFANLRVIDTVPDAGIHPRIYFGPSEIPTIQANLQSTTSGQEVFKQLHAYTTLLHLGYGANGTYNHNSTYGSDAFGNKRIDNAGKWDRSVTYNQLVNLDPNALTGVPNKDRYLLSSIMALEAFECLMMSGQTDPDTGLDYDDRAETLAKVMSFWAQLVIGDPDLNWENYHHFGGVHMAYAYDLNYNSMTTNQRDSVRMALAETIPPSPRYGSQTESYATTSNWVGLNSFELLTNFAIEGETGYNTTLTEDYMRSYWNFITYGWYASGAPYEGLGKNYQFVTSMIAAAKRGYSLLGHPHVKAYGQDFLPTIIQPYGHSFIGTDVWGGTGWDVTIGGYKNNASDFLGLKWMMPGDSQIDFAWRNYIEKYYKINSEGYVYQGVEPATSGYHNYLLTAAIFAEDYTSGNWESQNQTALNSLSAMYPERGLTVLRSGYTEEDMLVHFHTRQDLGGHTHGDRNNISFSSLGRVWFRYTYGSEFQPTEYHSCILVNDLGVPLTYKDGVKARQPGKLLSFSENTDHAIASADASYAYSWEWHWQAQSAGNDHPLLGTNGWTKVDETWNDFRFQSGTEYYHDLPFYDYADWRSPNQFERMIKKSYNPMQKVERSIALVRSPRPYLIVVDDVNKDNTVHNYKWLGQIANDLELESTTVNLYATNFKNDLIFKEQNGTRKLLVRVLNKNGQCEADLNLPGNITSGTYDAADQIISNGTVIGTQNVTYEAGHMISLEDGFCAPISSDFLAHIVPCQEAPGYHEVVTPGINGNSPISRIVLESVAITPDFKVMLFPFNDGESLPITNWNAAKDQLTVTVNGQTQTINFTLQSGSTSIQVN